MRRGRQRANIILTALFISIFLFFLSVALVAANRQDLRLELFVDHRLRAEMAARAGAHWALQTMRADPDWRSALAPLEREPRAVDSGATWTVAVRPFADPGGTDYLWEIEGRGKSGFLTATYRLVVEEIRFGADLETSEVPLLFMVAENGEDLAFLDSDTFRWQLLPNMVNRPRSMLAARDGPLFSFGPEGSATPPGIRDWVPVTTPYGTVEPSTPEGAPPPLVDVGSEDDQHLTWLTFTPTDTGQVLADWVDIPEPHVGNPPPVGRIWQAEPSVDGIPWSEDPAWQWTTLFRDGQEIRVPLSRFRGPVLEWYALTGTALAADGKTVLCHAEHHFYRGAFFYNEVLPDGSVRSVVQEAVAFEEPAVLAYDLETGDWEVRVDTMQVTDPGAEPQVTSGPRPDPATLGLADGRVYAYQRGDSQQILEGNPRGWSPWSRSTGVSGGLFEYRRRLAYHTLTDTGVGLLAGVPPALDPAADLSLQRPALETFRFRDGEFQRIYMDPAVEVQASMLGDLESSGSFRGPLRGANAVAVTEDKILVTVVRMKRVFRRGDDPGIPFVDRFDDEFFDRFGTTEYLALAKYDGQHWQLWPGGVWPRTAALEESPGNFVPVRYRDREGDLMDLNLLPYYLALARYPGSPPRQAKDRQSRFNTLVVLR